MEGTLWWNVSYHTMVIPSSCGMLVPAYRLATSIETRVVSIATLVCSIQSIKFKKTVVSLNTTSVT